jgi:hypothetical protein
MTRRMTRRDPIEKEIELPLRSGEFISDCACFSLASGFEEAAAKMGNPGQDERDSGMIANGVPG